MKISIYYIYSEKLEMLYVEYRIILFLIYELRIRYRNLMFFSNP